MIKITHEKLEQLHNAFASKRDNLIETGVRYGCDCGCGGDIYSDKEWEDISDELDNAQNCIDGYLPEMSSEQKSKISENLEIYFLQDCLYCYSQNCDCTEDEKEEVAKMRMDSKKFITEQFEIMEA